MKNSTSQTKNPMETITNRLDQEEEGISGIHDKIKEVSYSNNSKVKKKKMQSWPQHPKVLEHD
jgi:hypothetical protein